MTCRVIGFGGAAVEVHCDGAAGRAIADYLFARTGSDPGAGVLGTVRVGERGDGEFRVWRDDSLLYQGDSDRVVTGLVLETVCNLFGEHCTRGALLHAGLVSANGMTVLLPGESGRGKTSVTAWLLHRGYSYLTDELCYVEPGADRLHGLARPLNLKSPAVDIVRREMQVDTGSSEVRTSSFATLIPPHLFGDGGVMDHADPGVVVFPHYTTAAEPGLFALSKTDTAMGLLRSLVNVHRMGGAAVSETSRIARTCPGYSLRYSSFTQVDDAFRRLLAGAAA